MLESKNEFARNLSGEKEPVDHQGDPSEMRKTKVENEAQDDDYIGPNDPYNRTDEPNYPALPRE